MNNQKKWYDNNSLVYLLLFVFFPVGIYGLWHNQSFSKKKKKTLTAGILILVVFYLVIGPPPQTSKIAAVKAPPAQSGSVTIDLAGNSKPQYSPVTAQMEKKVAKAIPQKPKTAEDYLKEADAAEAVLVEIEQRRRRLETGHSYKDGAWLTRWNKATKQWERETENIPMFKEANMYADNPCERSLVSAKLSMGRLVQLGIGYIYKDRRLEGVTNERQWIKEETQEAREYIKQCRDTMAQQIALKLE